MNINVKTRVMDIEQWTVLDPDLVVYRAFVDSLESDVALLALKGQIQILDEFVDKQSPFPPQLRELADKIDTLMREFDEIYQEHVATYSEGKDAKEPRRSIDGTHARAKSRSGRARKRRSRNKAKQKKRQATQGSSS